MKFDYKNISDLIISWGRKDAQLYEALKRVNGFCVELNKFLNDPHFDTLKLGTAIFDKDRNQLSQASAMTQMCRIYHDADQFVFDSAVAALEFNTTKYDTDGMHEVVLYSRITFQTPGYYNVGGCVVFESIGASIVKTFIKLNGATVIVAQMGSDPSRAEVQTEVNLSTTYYFKQHDYITLEVYHLVLGGINVLAIEDYSPHLWAHRLS
jgi:hypothetical protein